MRKKCSSLGDSMKKTAGKNHYKENFTIFLV